MKVIRIHQGNDPEMQRAHYRIEVNGEMVGRVVRTRDISRRRVHAWAVIDINGCVRDGYGTRARAVDALVNDRRDA
jgi:hypothetical protein